MRRDFATLALALALAGAAPAGFAAADESEIYRPGEGVTAPKPVHKVEPYYTFEARRAQVQGTVVLEVVVDEHGVPARISTVSPIGFGLDQRAHEAVSLWRFRPGRKDGKAVKTVTMVAVKFRLFRRLCDPGLDERRTSYNLAVDQIHKHHCTGETLDSIKTLAQQKYPPAMYLYAKMLQAGENFPRDPETARMLILEASSKRYPAAMFEEGRMRLEGHGLPRDPDRGLELVRDAAILHNRAAQFFLGAEYDRGGLLRKSPEEAREYYRLCARQGETVCQVRLAKLLLEKPGRGESEYLQALAWLEVASDHGDPQARSLLETERGELSDSQTAWVDKLKAQFAPRQ